MPPPATSAQASRFAPSRAGWTWPCPPRQISCTGQRWTKASCAARSRWSARRSPSPSTRRTTMSLNWPRARPSWTSPWAARSLAQWRPSTPPLPLRSRIGAPPSIRRTVWWSAPPARWTRTNCCAWPRRTSPTLKGRRRRSPSLPPSSGACVRPRASWSRPTWSSCFQAPGPGIPTTSSCACSPKLWAGACRRAFSRKRGRSVAWPIPSTPGPRPTPTLECWGSTQEPRRRTRRNSPGSVPARSADWPMRSAKTNSSAPRPS